jgi:outer membrane lipoprotein carrier protein
MKKILLTAGWVVWAVLATALTAPAETAAQEPPQAVLARMERAFAGMTSFQADFVQSATSMTTMAPLPQKGRVFFRRPDAMRWEYGSPEKNVYVFKAGLLLSYFPEDNQLWRQRIPPEKSQSEILDLLSGKGGLASKYVVENSPFPESAPGSAQLKLTPREEGEYSYFLLEIDRPSGLIRRAIFFDWGGNRTEFTFSKLKPGARLADATFEIKVPKDCEIVDETGPLKR